MPRSVLAKKDNGAAMTVSRTAKCCRIDDDGVIFRKTRQLVQTSEAADRISKSRNMLK
jgi:hypothetical protein